VDFDNFSGRLNTFAIFTHDGTTHCFLAKNGFDKQRWMIALEKAFNGTPSLFQSIVDAGVASDSRGIILEVNQACCEMFGYEKVRPPFNTKLERKN
jgi:PAS domain-containing protein